IGKLTTALQEETQLNLIDNEEDYLKKYQEIVMKRCEHLLKQSGQITSIKL
ncbi:TPA: type II toxin-antitoxin system HipA family toxin, partial [Legionella pneumophila]|nr:type II toxin-antitoxin system HipA family toxin [Legionella pneumophila]